MEIRVLRYFLAVAREESISGAADYLHLTQPTLSRQLMDLEEELGKKLFLRGSRKVTLTEDGLLLRKRAEEILDLVEKTQSEFHETDQAGISGDIYIGGGETQAMRMVAQTARELQADHPQIRYHLYSGNAEDVSERLDKGLLDFGMMIRPFDIKKYDSVQLPATDTWGVLMRKDSPLAERDCIRPRDLWDVPLLTSRQRMAQKELMEWLGKKPEELNLVSTYNLIYNASLMVEEGLGYAMTLAGLVNTAGDSVLCFRPPGTHADGGPGSGVEEVSGVLQGHRPFFGADAGQVSGNGGIRRKPVDKTCPPASLCQRGLRFSPEKFMYLRLSGFAGFPTMFRSIRCPRWRFQAHIGHRMGRSCCNTSPHFPRVRSKQAYRRAPPRGSRLRCPASLADKRFSRWCCNPAPR